MACTDAFYLDSLVSTFVHERPVPQSCFFGWVHVVKAAARPPHSKLVRVDGGLRLQRLQPLFDFGSFLGTTECVERFGLLGQ